MLHGFRVIAINLILFVVILAGVEFYLRISDRSPKLNHHFDMSKYTVNEAHAVRTFTPSARIHHQLDVEPGGKIFDVFYNTNEYGHRMTPVEGQRHKHMLFLGCSIVMGSGVNDNESIPYFMGTLAKEHRPYNLGIGGRGLSTVLRSLSELPVEQEVQEREGIAFLFFYDFHFYRDVPAIRESSWTRFPYYTFDKDGKPTYHGWYHEQHPWMFSVMEFLSGLKIVQRLPIDDLFYSDEVKKQTVLNFVRASKQAYLKKFPQGRFFVVLAPKYPSRFAELLPVHGIDVIDLQKTPLNGQASLRMDDHFAREGNEAVALALYQKLREQKILAAGGDIIGKTQ